MGRTILVLLVVLGSSWFIPVSCTSGTFVGMRLLAKGTARDMTHGEVPHSSGFYVITELPDKKVKPVLLTELDRFKRENAEAKNLLTKDEGTVEEGLEKWEYSVKKEGVEKQEITVSYRGDDLSSKSVYSVDKEVISPLYSEIMSIGHMFTAGVFALVLSFGIRFFARVLYKKFRQQQTNGGHGA